MKRIPRRIFVAGLRGGLGPKPRPAWLVARHSLQASIYKPLGRWSYPNRE